LKTLIVNNKNKEFDNMKKTIILFIALIILLGLNSSGVLGIEDCKCGLEDDCDPGHFCDGLQQYTVECTETGDPNYYIGFCARSTEGRPCGVGDSCYGSGLYCSYGEDDTQ